MSTNKIDLRQVELIEPVWKDNYVAIVACSNNNYVPYLSVYLESIKNFATDDTNYDIVILEADITDANKNILKNTFEVKKNLSLRFYNPSIIFKNSDFYLSHSYFTKEIYFRFSISISFKKYKKVIYTDIDTVFNNNPKKLYDIEMENYAIMAVLEPMWSIFINTKAVVEGIDITNFTKNTLKLKNLHRYFNSGVILINIEKFSTYSELLFSKLTPEVKYIFGDQSIINEVINSEIGTIPYEWNYEVINRQQISNAHKKIQEYCSSNTKSIIHWIGSRKPWFYPERDLAYLWWQYARRTPYYEIILERMFSHQRKKAALNKEDLACVLSYRKNILTYWRYKLLSKITFGKRKEHYTTKRYLWKEKIKKAKKIRGGV